MLPPVKCQFLVRSAQMWDRPRVLSRFLNKTKTFLYQSQPSLRRIGTSHGHWYPGDLSTSSDNSLTR